MPQLQSGKFVAISFAVIDKFIADSKSGKSLEEFFSIRTREELLWHIPAFYFRARAEGIEPNYFLKDHSAATPAGMEIYYSGFTLGTVETDVRNWDVRDKAAMLDWLSRDDVRAEFEAKLKEIRKAQDRTVGG
jgi:hypothetical protein